ncbi:hypothetical protein C0Q70_16118 [Pomacea canaliculata]|uniref:Uncharacterized protein n=1 Tax=Pomacea canaliculata TaxID=400727 RepID=A0A2T7NNW1_POMCA|nr:hypothetical protein C0Q70_16118 [Pomacea canaliculata]
MAIKSLLLTALRSLAGHLAGRWVANVVAAVRVEMEDHLSDYCSGVAGCKQSERQCKWEEQLGISLNVSHE